MNFHPILAADLIQTIFGVIVFVIWIVGQILGSREQAKRKQKPARPQRQPVAPADMGQRPINQGPANQGPAQQGPRNQEDALRSEVEEFLRRAQGKTEQPKPVPQRQLAESKPSSRRQPSEQKQQRREKKRRQEQQAERKQLSKPLSPGQDGAIRTEGVADHVARHLSTEDIAAQTRTLGSEVAAADDRVEARLHEKFDHDLGQLQHRETPIELQEVDADIASEVAAMIRRPEGMRQLIIANEILRRPDW